MIKAVERHLEGYCPDLSRLASASTKTYLNPNAPHYPHRHLWLAHPPQADRLRVKYPQHATPQAQTEHATLQSPALQDANARQIASVG